MLQLNQLTIDGIKNNLRTVDRDSVQNAVDILNNLLDTQCKVTISGAVITIGSSEVQMVRSDGDYGTTNADKIGIAPIASKYTALVASTLDVSTGVVTGDFQTGQPIAPSMSVGEYIAVALELRTDKKWYLVWGIPQVVKINTLAEANSPVFSPSSPLKRAIIVLQKGGAGDWSFSNPSETDLINLQMGGGGTGSGDANSIVEDYKDYLDQSGYEFWSAMVFSIDEEAKNDIVNTTASFSIADGVMDFTTSSQIVTSINLLNSDFLDERSDIVKVDVILNYAEGEVDSAPILALSRNGGNEYQTVTISRIDNTNTYQGSLYFSEESTYQTLEEYSSAFLASEQALTATSTNTKLSQEFITSGSAVVTEIEVYINKTGSPAGTLYVEVVQDSSGSPSEAADRMIIQTLPVDITSLTAGINIVTLNASGAIITGATTYHISFRTDTAYKSSYVASTTQIGVETDSSSPTIAHMKQWNGATWSTISGSSAGYKITGRSLDLRVKVTASMISALKGLCVFYYEQPMASTKWSNVEVKTVNTSADTTVFTINKYIVDRDFLEVFYAEKGLVYRFPAFQVAGNTITFPSGTFYELPATTGTIIFDQNQGCAFDNSDLNGAIIAANHLGSVDSGLDRSVAGRGLFLRKPNGTLREICIDDNDNIVIYSV